LTACRLGFLTVIVASPVALTFPLLHKVWIARPHEAFLFRLAECFGTKVRAALALGLSLLWLERMLHHVCIRPHSCDLPRDFRPRSATGDPELVLIDLFGNVQAQPRRTDGSELVTEIAVECPEPVWQCYDSPAVLPKDDVSSVEVQHF